MPINYATLAKEHDDVIEYIYPKTAAKIVEYTSTQTVEEALNELNEKVNGINIEGALVNYPTLSQVKDMTYRPISLQSVTVSPDIVEAGSTNAVTVYWTADQVPATMSIDGIPSNPSNQTGSQVFTNIQYDRTFVVSVTDHGTDTIAPYTSTKAATVRFFNGIYFGASTEPYEYTSAFVLTLPTKRLQASPAGSFTVNPGDAQYIFFACPSNFNPIFNVNGFSGGFAVAATINFTNAYGHTIAYTIYRSANANLGNTTVTVFC